MYKLLPPKTITKVKHEYLLRRISVILALIATLVLFAVVTLLPTTIFYLEKREAALFTLGVVDDPKQDNTDKSSEDLDRWVERVKADLTALTPENNQDEVYASLQKVLVKRPSSIYINSMSWNKAPNGNKSLKVGGVALTRQALVLFQEELSRSNDWAQVDFPVSVIARESNIPFEINLTLPKKK